MLEAVYFTPFVTIASMHSCHAFYAMSVCYNEGIIVLVHTCVLNLVIIVVIRCSLCCLLLKCLQVFAHVQMCSMEASRNLCIFCIYKVNLVVTNV